MGCEIFKYTNGYDYDEYAAMCDLFKEMKLPFLKGYDVNRLLAGYIFGYSMKRFPVGRKSTLRRFLGGFFLYPVKEEGEGDVAFVFTGDGAGRPDYIECIKKVKAECSDSKLYMIDRQNPKFRIGHIFCWLPELVWACRLNKTVKDFNISFDMAVGIYRAKKQGEYIYSRLNHSRAVITYCDIWEAESAVTQKALHDHILTATLQHGNGTDIMYGSCSDYYLANSKLSKANCIHAGIPEEKIILAGPMKYAGEKFSYKNIDRIRNIGVVFDGALNYENNVEMIRTVHEAIANTDIRCCIRFHPNNKREDYRDYISDNDVVYDNLAEFEQNIDMCVVYNSSMYTDMIYKRIPVYRFKNGRTDLFPGLEDRGFRNSDGLKRLIDNISANSEEYRKEQETLYDRVFGRECRADSYKTFFERNLPR